MQQELEALAGTIGDLEGRADVCRRLHRVLAPLREYDARTGGDLALTLRVYVESGGNVAATGDRLFLHRNSVGYRLQRIKELSGLDLRERGTRRLLLVAFALTDPSLLEPVAREEKDDEDQRA